MAVRLYADGVSGKCAIYTGTDDLPFSTPLSYVSRLRFHSDLEYPRIISTHTGSVVLPSVAANTIHRDKKTLFAHGQSGNPYVEGYFKIGAGSTRHPFVGSFPVQQCTGDAAYNAGTGCAAAWARWVHLGSDATNVVLSEHVFNPEYGDTLPSITLNYTIYLTDYMANGSVNDGGLTNETIRIEDDTAVFGGGKFSTAYNYVRTGSSGVSFPMARGRTVDVSMWDYIWDGGNNKYRAFAWKYDDGTTTKEWIHPQFSDFRATATPSSFSAIIDDCTIE